MHFKTYYETLPCVISNVYETVLERQPECFKPLLDSGDLRPQRKSFMSGCQMKNSVVGEAGDKGNGSAKSGGGQQRRTSESSDR